VSVLALVSVSVADTATHTKEIIGTFILTCFNHTRIKSNGSTWLNLLLATERVRLLLLPLLCSSKILESLRLLQSLLGLGEWIAILPKLVSSLRLRELLHWLLELSLRRSSKLVALLLISEWISLLELLLLGLAKHVSLCLSKRVQNICVYRFRLGKLVGSERRKLKLSSSKRIHLLLLGYCLSCRWLLLCKSKLIISLRYLGWRWAIQHYEWVVASRLLR